MVKKKTYVLACAALVMMVALSACSSSADQPKTESEKVNTEATSGTAEPAVTDNTDETATDTEAASTPAASEASTDAGQTVAAEDMPEHLPKDFPLPEDAKVTTATSTENDGKKSAILIFTTEQDMKTISKLYKDYFTSKKLTDSGQIIDEKNIIIQGTEPDQKHSWSLIGGAMASKQGVIELTLTWSES
ncbi:hypothetical protein HUB98_09800 [Paenibacillus barcinonensis]|uniref:Lipoprotein n=1 Tax=Paenibacillus barcinonensis TaxID=198119 RepID=A0A2V4W4V0_PAEBA|nr:hypothetical protein [Paenibacillus barcinonensis]PYE49696.1 hypothetical protein DFQ00_105200 [Paenibacillus barcinonensis]QKS56600.1 hypothetical protein HUB98_09800 [Paenibacillus barcinonensis]